MDLLFIGLATPSVPSRRRHDAICSPERRTRQARLSLQQQPRCQDTNQTAKNASPLYVNSYREESNFETYSDEEDVFLSRDSEAFRSNRRRCSVESVVSSNSSSELRNSSDELDVFSEDEDDFGESYNDVQLHEKLHSPPQSTLGTQYIQWPLDNKTKRKRLAQIRKQVRDLSSAIKMTIEGGRLGGGGLTAPFSSHVDASLLTFSRSNTLDAALPELQDLSALLKEGNVKEYKNLVRKSHWPMEHLIRGQLWKRLAQHQTREEFSDQYYWDTVQQIYGTKELSESYIVLPTFVDRAHTPCRALTREGVKSCERVTSVIANTLPDITFAPLVYPMTALLLHYMNEADAFNCVTALLSKNSLFIFQTKSLHESMWRTVETLARKHVRGAYGMLPKYGVSAEQATEAFRSWVWLIFGHLPLPHLVRVIDCFLTEGSKVLLRVCLALFQLFMKEVARDASTAAALTTKGLAEPMANFCANIPVSPNKLLQTAFGIRAFSKSEIEKIVTQTESVVRSVPCLTTSPICKQRQVTTSMEGLPTPESQDRIQTLSHTLDIKELLTIWSWIPLRMTMCHPKLIYTTQEHGSTLTSFYQRVEKHEPTILLVRTTTDEVFGAYCSAAWKRRNVSDEFGHCQTYFGTGETFLFKLRPTPERFEWVGTEQSAKGIAVPRQAELFMHADLEMVTVGGGQGHGLMLDQELRFGKTEFCSTFENPPLCKSQDFNIKVVEVFSLGEAN